MKMPKLNPVCALFLDVMQNGKIESENCESFDFYNLWRRTNELTGEKLKMIQLVSAFLP